MQRSLPAATGKDNHTTSPTRRQKQGTRPSLRRMRTQPDPHHGRNRVNFVFQSPFDVSPTSVISPTSDGDADDEAEEEEGGRRDRKQRLDDFPLHFITHSMTELSMKHPERGQGLIK